MIAPPDRGPGGCRLGHGGVGGDRPVEDAHPIELRRRASPPARARSGVVAAATRRRTSSGPPGPGTAPRAGVRAASRHSGSRSKGNCVRNDDMVPIPRQWVSPNIRPRQLPRRRSSRENVASTPDGDGHPVRTANSSSRSSRAGLGVDGSWTNWKIRCPGLQHAHQLGHFLP